MNAAALAFAPDVGERLSPSSVSTFVYDCSAKWFYRSVLGIPERGSGARALGSAVHAAIAENFRDKIETGEDLPADGVVAVFRDALTQELDGDVALQPGESAAELRDTGDALVRVYLDQAAPLIQPAAVELEVTGTIGGVGVRGYVDLLTTDGMIVDIKTAAKKPSKLSAAHSLQLTTYAMLTPGATGQTRLDTITKGKRVDLHQQSVTIGEADKNGAARLYSITRDAMQTGLVVPNRSSFLCSRKHCGYWERCLSEYSGRVPA